jgi:hypothetical protein
MIASDGAFVSASMPYTITAGDVAIILLLFVVVVLLTLGIVGR